MTRRPRTLVSAVAGVCLGAAVLVPGLQPAATAAPVPDASNATRAASGWLATAHPTGVLTTGGVADWGLTADGVFAQAAGGRGPTAGETATDQIEDHLLDYASNPAGTGRGAGPIAKVLLVAVVQGRDVTAFGGWDLRAELLALMTTTPGADLGRFKSVGVPDTTNTFGQSLAVVGLARSGSVPGDAVGFLLDQQCPAGGFRLFFLGAGCTADAAADVDATALAIQGLIAADLDGVDGLDQPLAEALDWLEGVQNADGSFTASGPSGVPNANTSSLVSQALRAAGRTDAADAASAWVRGLQLDCDLPALVADHGAVAYGPEAYDDTVAGGVIDVLYADQFVRTTTEAALAFGAPSLAALDGTTTSAAPGGFDCSASTSSTTSTPSSTSSTLPGGSSTSSTSTTAAPSTTTSTTTIAVLTSGTSVTNPAARVEGISTSSGSSGSTGSTGGAGLAATGLGAGRVALAAALFAVSGGLFVEARRRRG